MARVTRDKLAEAQQRSTIARMLDLGGVVTPLGPNTTIRLDSGGFGTFPSRLVAEVQHERRAWAKEWTS
jgi:hypothetical protein